MVGHFAVIVSHNEVYLPATVLSDRLVGVRDEFEVGPFEISEVGLNQPHDIAFDEWELSAEEGEGDHLVVHVDLLLRGLLTAHAVARYNNTDFVVAKQLFFLIVLCIT